MTSKKHDLKYRLKREKGDGGDQTGFILMCLHHRLLATKGGSLSLEKSRKASVQDNSRSSSFSKELKTQHFACDCLYHTYTKSAA